MARSVSGVKEQIQGGLAAPNSCDIIHEHKVGFTSAVWRSNA